MHMTLPVKTFFRYAWIGWPIKLVCNVIAYPLGDDKLSTWVKLQEILNIKHQTFQYH
jgi:hypothetical protein